MQTVLVCDDDKQIVEAIDIYLTGEGFRVVKAYDGYEALELLETNEVDLMIVDVMMPGLDGIRTTLKVRETSSIPIIILSAKSEDNDKILGLNIGADDYISKPFNPLELVARVKSHLRRYTQLGNLTTQTTENVYKCGGLLINDDNKEVSVDGELIKLTPIEYNILLLLVKNAGKVFSINEIYEQIWNEEAIGADNTVAVHIRHIREKIEINPREPRYLKVVWGVGYKIEKQSEIHMKRGLFPIALKKQTAIFLHLLFLVLSFAGITFIIFNVNYGRGLNWLREESYADTFHFSSQLEEDVENIFKYVRYKDLLELDGEVNLDAEMFCVTYNSGNTKIYTLNEAVSYARRLGYYLNDNSEVVGGPDVHEWDTLGLSTPYVEWKTYAPNEVSQGPGDAFSTVEELSVQVLNVLGEYYQVRNNYIDQPSNLYFRVSYVDDEGNELLYTNAADLSNEQLREMGRYLYMSGNSLYVDTNLRHMPDNVISLLSNNNRYGNEDYYILLGVDVNFPYQDPYSRAHVTYTRNRTEYIGGAILFCLGVLGLLITLAVMATLTGHVDGDREKISLHYYDRLPFECLILLYLILLKGAGIALATIIPRIVRLFVTPDYHEYSLKMARYVLYYLVSLFAALSALRNYKAHTLWSGSLLCRGLKRILPALSGYPLPLRFTAGFIGYLFCDFSLLAAGYYLYRQKDALSLPYLYLVPLLVLIGFQIWVYLILYRSRVENQKIASGIFKMSEGDTGYKIDSSGFSAQAERVSQALNTLSDGLETALSEQVKSERLKADLITNVSHDIKTPLTSIINYVDLLKRENIKDEKIQGYLEVLDQKSQRLKTLTEDLVEASKASSGNLKLEISDINLVELVQQASGEFEERFAARRLELVSNLPDEEVLIAADGRRLWRVLENLYNNAFKYAMENSRIYVDVTKKDGSAFFTIKNVSANPLNISADELTERFVRGDVARTTEGSGLGLSIAKSLTLLQGGSFEIYIDGDLFKAQVGFGVLRG